MSFVEQGFYVLPVSEGKGLPAGSSGKLKSLPAIDFERR
jgi:hypothetical protein